MSVWNSIRNDSEMDRRKEDYYCREETHREDDRGWNNDLVILICNEEALFVEILFYGSLTITAISPIICVRKH